MKDQDHSLPQALGSNLLVQVKVHPVRPMARSDEPNLREPCLPDSLLWQYPANVFSQETPFISDAINPCTAWLHRVNGPTARSPTHSRSQILEKPLPLTFAPSDFNGSFCHQSEAIPFFRTHAGYNKVAIEEEEIQLTGCQLPEPRVDSPSPESIVQLCFSLKPSTFSSEVCSSQATRQQLEALEIKGARQNPDLGSAFNFENRSKACVTLRRVHHCANCKKVYRRPQDLKRHTRDSHEWQRKCPFCCARWSRPERIRAHLMKKHISRLTKDQQEEIGSLRGRDDTIRFLENCGNATHPGNYKLD